MSVEDIATKRALGYVRGGMSPRDAIDRACSECGALSGLGQAAPPAAAIPDPNATEITATNPLSTYIPADVLSTVQEGNAIVSPWLWIVSIVGFGLSVWNKYQINKMYGSWKKAKAHHGV